MRLFLIALALAHTARASYYCYYCKDFQSSSAVPYDANCNQNGYSGNKVEEMWSQQCCYTKIYDNGNTVRSGCQGESDGQCKEGDDAHGHYNECFCIGDSCNNDQCPDCGGPPPPTGPVGPTTKPPNPGGDYQCYYCNNYDQGSKVPYDANCGNNNYHGNAADQNGDDQCCYTIHYDNGNVLRTGCSGHGDGECRDGSGWTGCYCTGDKCNDNICQECGVPGPTGETTEAPPNTTPVNPGHTTTPGGPTDPHTDPHKTTTPSGPSLGLSCYTCMNCPTVDTNTPTISDPDYNSCFIQLVTGSHVVYRGGSKDHHNDGECIMVDGNMTCFCVGDNCNGTDAL